MMNSIRFRARLEAIFADNLRATQFLLHEVVVDLLPTALPQEVHAFAQEFQATFVDMFGVDTGEGKTQFHLLFALDDEHLWCHLRVHFDATSHAFPSMTKEFPALDWYERVVWEELGLLPQGHPFLHRLRLPTDWPEDVYPQHHLFLWSHQVEWVQPRPLALEIAPVGVVDYPLGPVRSGVVESGHYTLRTVGEEIVDMNLQLFYKYRAIEKRAEGLSIAFLPLLAERISGTSAFAHSLALCQALERVAAIEIPARVQFLRTLFAELERLYNHLGYQADLCQATGLVVGQAQFDILKERVLRLNAHLCGHRYLFGLNVPGGLSRDLHPEDKEAVATCMSALRRDIEMLRQLLLASPSHLDRLEATGILSPDEARAYGAVGPIGRASGLDRDLRRDHPYAAYGQIDFDIPVLREDDAFARARVRLEETMQSLHIIEQVLEQLPDGAVRVPMRPLPPGASASGWVESPRGESLHWLQVGEDGTLHRYRVRPASFANWQAFPVVVPGHNILTDFPVIEQSFGLSFAGANG
ncbi:MAG TPA: NADH-quinone oxidoreductase subunit F [Ktedonobacter sp.]|nr:NADH-quinone oxidoreductase subunit F [Ktedonobacter sp.]